MSAAVPQVTALLAAPDPRLSVPSGGMGSGPAPVREEERLHFTPPPPAQDQSAREEWCWP